MADRVIPCMFVGYTKDHEGDWYDMLHPPSITIYQSWNVTWLKHIYYHKELDEDNEDLLPLPQKDNSNNEEQDDHAKVYIIDTDGNESDSEDKIMSEDKYADHSVIARDYVTETKTIRSGMAVIPPEIMKDYEIGGARLDSY